MTMIITAMASGKTTTNNNSGQLPGIWKGSGKFKCFKKLRVVKQIKTHKLGY